MCKKIVNVSIDQIKKYLTNRSPYLMIDKATEIIPGVSSKGYKNLSANEWFFAVHFPEEPMMPGMIQMEALLQMLSLTVLTLEGCEGKTVQGVSADRIRLKKKVVPGCRLDIETDLVSWDGHIASGRARGLVNEEMVCSAEFTFAVLNVE